MRTWIPLLLSWACTCRIEPQTQETGDTGAIEVSDLGEVPFGTTLALRWSRDEEPEVTVSNAGEFDIDALEGALDLYWTPGSSSEVARARLIVDGETLILEARATEALDPLP
ncbi:MAG: hypothetical protein QGG40_19795, partial [Myxococcota bacterium]|nr:hypothetical protein [Myxococcota bacterium]